LKAGEKIWNCTGTRFGAVEAGRVAASRQAHG